MVKFQAIVNEIRLNEREAKANPGNPLCEQALRHARAKLTAAKARKYRTSTQNHLTNARVDAELARQAAERAKDAADAIFRELEDVRDGDRVLRIGLINSAKAAQLNQAVRNLDHEPGHELNRIEAKLRQANDLRASHWAASDRANVKEAALAALEKKVQDKEEKKERIEREREEAVEIQQLDDLTRQRDGELLLNAPTSPKGKEEDVRSIGIR